MTSKPLAQWLQHLETLHPSEMELGLERVSQVAQSLELLPLALPVVTVAGTNGKGSTVAVLESLLSECGFRPGAFTSPHFLRFNERIRVNREEVADEGIVSAFEAIEAARGDVSLTYFEFATLAALLVFKREAVDYVLLEVGLGGRLDSANMIDADVAVITSIDLDHQDWLGSTKGLIAKEKAGIMRRGRPVVIADSAPPPELLQAAQDLEAGPVYRLGKEFECSGLARCWQGRLVHQNGATLSLVDMASTSLLPANVCAAAEAALLLGVEFRQEKLQQAIETSIRPGRLQRVQVGGLHYLLDVAHNPAAIDKLLENIAATPCNGKVIALFSAMKDKAIDEMLAPCVGQFDAWFLGEQADNPRAMPAAQIGELLREQGQGAISVSKNLRQAFRRAQSVMSEEDLLVVFGSFFTVAAVLPQLEKDRGKFGTDE
ncbi:MAG: folylpolyglutamate synthase/dihydrofolate synthase family protein [Halioglobus sp.]